MSGLNLPRSGLDDTPARLDLALEDGGRKEASLLDGELFCVAGELAPRFVDPAIGTAGDKADDLVTVEDPDFASVRGHIFSGVVLPKSVR